MSYARAVRLWGRIVVDRALDHPTPAALTPDLLAAVRRACDGPDDPAPDFAEWAMGLESDETAAVVRLVTTDGRADILAAYEAEDAGDVH